MTRPKKSKPTAADVVTAARSWLDTPFRHKHRAKGIGVDCIMLAWAVGEEAGVITVDPAVWEQFKGYGRAPNPARMRQALAASLVEITEDQAGPGDIVWVHWGHPDLPMHLAILADKAGRPTLIHARADIRSNAFPDGRVVEHGFAEEWRERVAGWWRYPGLAGA